MGCSLWQGWVVGAPSGPSLKAAPPVVCSGTSLLQTQVKVGGDRTALSRIFGMQVSDRALCMQVRAGTGGDEAALWVSELVRMYQRYAEQQQWKLSFISSTEADKGGYRECIVQVTSRRLRQELSQCKR